LKVELLINAAQLNVERVLIYLFRGEQREPAFLAVNPMGQIPVLKDDGLNLLESNAILIYLAQQFRPDLYFNSPAQHTLGMQWLFWQSSEWTRAASSYHHQRIVKPAWGDKTNEIQIQQNERRFFRMCNVLDATLQKRPFLVSKTPTIADISIAAQLLFWQEAQIPLDQFPAIKEWLNALSEVFWWKTSKDQAQLFLTKIHAYTCLGVHDETATN
jgi:glutathione S-transferase